jgi:HK97 family phage prohead protease
MAKQIKTVLAAIVKGGGNLGARQIRVVASDATLDRMGDVMVPQGCDCAAYRANPIVLAQHDPNVPIGIAKITVSKDRVEALIDFAPEGISAKADEYCGLAKAGIISAVSIGFDPLESTPRAGGGYIYNKWTLLELSLVSVPANPAATVIERAAPAVTTAESKAPFIKIDGKWLTEAEFRDYDRNFWTRINARALAIVQRRAQRIFERGEADGTGRARRLAEVEALRNGPVKKPLRTHGNGEPALDWGRESIDNYHHRLHLWNRGL